MWDRLLTDCHVATMVAAPGNPLGVMTNAAIGIVDGRIVRVGKRTELAGFRARDVVALGGAWVTPGLIDCHTHLVFGGTRANEHAMRRAGATYEQIAQAGGGIASTVAATKAASADELRGSARTGLPLPSPPAVSRKSKCASSVIRPTSLNGIPSPSPSLSPSTAGRVTALFPPTTNVSECRSTLRAHAARIGPVASSIVKPSIATSP